MAYHPRNIKVVLVFLIIISLGAVLSIFIHHRLMTSGPAKILNKINSKASVTLNRVQQTAMRDGVQEWTLDAASASLFETEKKAVFQAPQVTFFMEDKTRILLSADRGVLWTHTNDLDVEGHVIVTHKDYQLKTEKLHYQHKNRIITSNTPVELTGNLFQFKANTMTFTLGSNETRLEGNVEGTLSGTFSL